MPRYYFLGLYRIPMYEYYWGHTCAQIELIDIDAPMVCYKKRDKNEGKKPGDKGYVYDRKKLDAATKRWKERKAAREARGWNLKKFLATGKKERIGDNAEQ